MAEYVDIFRLFSGNFDSAENKLPSSGDGSIMYGFGSKGLKKLVFNTDTIIGEGTIISKIQTNDRGDLVFNIIRNRHNRKTFGFLNSLENIKRCFKSYPENSYSLLGSFGRDKYHIAIYLDDKYKMVNIDNFYHGSKVDMILGLFIIRNGNDICVKLIAKISSEFLNNNILTRLSKNFYFF